jgi:hypothetical protein
MNQHTSYLSLKAIKIQGKITLKFLCDDPWNLQQNLNHSPFMNISIIYGHASSNSTLSSSSLMTRPPFLVDMLLVADFVHLQMLGFHCYSSFLEYLHRTTDAIEFWLQITISYILLFKILPQKFEIMILHEL